VSGSVVLVLVLGDKSFSGTVVGLSLTSPAVLDLVTLEVSLVLLDFDEELQENQERGALPFFRPTL